MCGCSGGMHGCSGGACVVAPGGVHACSGGGCMVVWGGHACLLRGGACMVPPGGACMVARGGHAWLLGGGGRAWDMTRYGDTVNERAVRILLECILVDIKVWLQRMLVKKKQDIVHN